LHGVVLPCDSNLSNVGISFYTPVLGVVCISSRPLRMQWAYDDLGTSELSVITDESEDRIGIDDIQADVVDSYEDLVSPAVSFGTEELDSDATVFDTLYVDMSPGVDLQMVDGSIPKISNFVSTPLDSMAEKDCRRQSSQRHHVFSQLRVSERDIAIDCQHFNAAHQLLAVYGWGSPTSVEQGGSYFSLTEIHSLWEAIQILRQNYMQLVADRDHLMEWGSAAYDALLDKEDEVSELTQQLVVTSKILDSTQLAFEESQLHLAEVTMELERLQSLPDFVQS